MIDYLNLKIGAARRLGFLRNAAKRHNEKFPPGSAATWRTMRYATFNSSVGLSQGMQSGESVWYAQDGEQFPREGYADECYRGIRHKGWLTEVSHVETARGLVVKLPHGKFIAGYEWSANDERVYFPELFDDATEAARRADGHAERFAEACLEDSRRFDDAQELEYRCQKLADHLAEKLARRNNPRFPDAREEARELLTELRELRQRLRDEFAAFL